MYSEHLLLQVGYPKLRVLSETGVHSKVLDIRASQPSIAADIPASGDMDHARSLRTGRF
jgi:hypothetical protein